MIKMKRSIDVVKWGLLILAAFSSAAFIVMVHWYNIPMVDDLQFSVFLREMSIFEFVGYEYNTFCGRFFGQFTNAIYLRLYEFFDTLMVGSMLVYVLEVFLIEQSLVRLFKIKHSKAVVYAVILLGLYTSIMHHIHSFFWMCAQGYSLMMSCTLFAYAYIRNTKEIKWYDYLITTILFAYLGAGYETFSPLLLVFMGICMLRYWYHYESIQMILKKQPLLVLAFVVATIFFFIMVCAPANQLRMETFAEQQLTDVSEYIDVVFFKFLSEVKSTVFRSPYLLLAFILMLNMQSNYSNSIKISTKEMIGQISNWLGILGGLVVLGLILETYALGTGSVGRALCYIALFSLFFVGVCAFYLTRWEKWNISNNTIVMLTICTATIIILFNIYSLELNHAELEKWQKEENDRIEYLFNLNQSGQHDMVLLKPIYEPEYHSLLDDMIYKRLIPKFTKKKLLNVTQLNPPIEPEYLNDAFRDFYYLNFEVAQDTVQ